ncbi:MAG TPA: outer membrane beta-barrel protein [Gammaproteobacteria bacterium]
MRKSIFGLLLAFGVLAATPAQAFDSDWRVKAGMLSLENDDGAATNVGLVYAMDFAGILGAEVEANTSIADGEFDAGIATVDHSTMQVGGYATLTTPGPIYFKAKAGLVYNDVDIGGASDSSIGEAIGIGAGFFGFEVEYTRSTVDFGGTDVDIDYISVAYGF